MSRIIDYGTLKASIASWLNRDDLTAQIPQFIGLMERRLFRTLRCPANEVVFQYLLDDTSDVFVLPPRYLSVKSFTYDTYALERISYWDYLDRRQKRESLQGIPRYFARQEDKLLLCPSPASGTTAELTFYADLSGLGQVSGDRKGDDDEPVNIGENPDLDSNNVLKIAPDVYLFGSLIYADAYLATRPEDLQKWEKMYAGAYLELTNYGKDEDLTGSQIIPSFFAGGSPK